MKRCTSGGRRLFGAAVVLFTSLTGCRASSTHGQSGEGRADRSIEQGELQKVVTVSQGWSHEEARQFYATPQGSLLVPYDWFLHLERAEDETLIRSAANVRRLGYIARTASGDNPDGLPVGFTKDQGTNRAWLGMTCAACHTAQVDFAGVGYLIDGAPTQGDLESLLRGLTGGLSAVTAEGSDEKARRFAGRVLGHEASADELRALRTEVTEVLKLRQAYNDRNLPREPARRFGFARYDAFGAILNEVTVRYLDCEENWRLSDAPVSYPFIWDTPHHDFVQWNGMAANDALRLGNLARNTGEVMGVFANVDVPERPPLLPGYGTSIRVQNLREIEARLEKLLSPQWPAGFPSINGAMASAGKELFAVYCVGCHNDIDRADARRKVIARTSNVGTDPQMAKNFVERTARTTRLQGTPVNFNPIPLARTFGPEAGAGEILIHLTVGGIVGAWREAPRDALAELRYRTDDIALDELREAPPDQRFKYKARPLNGIWATAPFLHNGSVPTLYELLLPARERRREFWVGRRDFDARKVGFESGPGDGLFRFDTTVPGNLNSGHEYGTGRPAAEGGDGKPALSEEQRWQLVEYMKQL